jgi:methionyl-tRNA formyltransferase
LRSASFLPRGFETRRCCAHVWQIVTMKEVKIIFFGTPEFAATILKRLISQYPNILVSFVITQPDKPVGRKKILTSPPVKILAKRHKIPIEQPEKIENCKLKIENLKPDLIIVAAFGQIIPKEILDIPKFGCLGVHPALLPKYRGPTPVQFAILKGDDKTGVTIFLMDEKMDHGPILAQKKIKIEPNETTPMLKTKLAKLGADLLIESIPKWVDGKINPKPQDHKKATYTKLLAKKDGFIDWKKLGLTTEKEVRPPGRSDLTRKRIAKETERMVRAFTPWPGTWTLLRPHSAKASRGFKEQTKRLKILKAHLEKERLVLDQVQIEGKNPVSWKEFKRGYSTTVAFL